MKNILTEYIATFIVVLICTGAVTIGSVFPNTIDLLGASLITGVIVTIMILIFGKISGAHLNPAVTMGFYLKRTITLNNSILYILAQCLAAITASFILVSIFPESSSLGETLPSVSVTSAFTLEFIATFFLMSSILYSLTNKTLARLLPYTVGMIIFLEIYFLGPYCGASMNPARSLGPALISGRTEFLWIFLTAPFLGAITASILFLNKKLPYGEN